MQGDRAIKIMDDFGNPKFLGKVIDGTFIMARVKSKHFFRKLNGWGIDKKVAEGLTDVHTFLLEDKDEGFTYEVSREHFLSNAESIHYDGHRPQLVLHIDEWKRGDE